MKRNPEYMESILRMFEDLLSSLPNQNSYTAILTADPNLQLAVADIYKEYLELSVRTVKTFGRGSISTNLIRLTQERSDGTARHNHAATMEA